NEGELSARMPLSQELDGFTRLGQSVGSSDWHFEQPLLRERRKLTADAVAKALTVRHSSCDPADAVTLRTVARSDRDDAVSIVHEFQRRIDGFVGAHGVQR